MTNEPTCPPPGANGLERKLGLFSLTNIVVANMIGAGIFTTSGLLMGDLHNPLVMLALWLVGGLVALCGALSYGELGAAFPHAGGEYAFLSRLYHPLLGFLAGWVSFFVGFSAPIAASAIGFSEYLTRAFPALLAPGLFPGPGEAAVMKKIYAILIIAVFTFIHTRGLKAGARVQNGLTGLKILLIVGLVGAGFIFGKGSLTHLTAAAPFRFDFAGIKTLGLSLMWIMFAYSGWNASAYVGSEVRDPSRNLPRSLLLGTAIVMLLYAALNLFYVFAVPPAQMEGVISIAGLAAGNLFGPSAGTVLSALISFALFSSLSAYLILGPRVYYSMARDGIFFKSIAFVDPRCGVPTRSILLQGGIAAVMVLFGTFEQLLTYMGFSLGLFPLLAVFGVFKLRRSGRSVVKLPGYPVAPAVYLVIGAAILVLSFLRQPAESLVAIATALAGVPIYFLFRRASRPRA
ncbi:MAG TPA: amino acid permease [Candidatus Aminicenantes bacterium]|nr:amino acid permease [Candidatus Aminicenantes bacterium]HRY64522.1 amino acid permease [Candidatus Aminicenantes bacterium]HRZ71435.1 amino acid permease [Candidatus Aminicenantes bacterium]